MNKKVVVVDDEQIIADGITNIIKRMGLPLEVVETFYASELAMTYLAENDVDIVISDINMPVYSGLDLIKRVSQLQPSTQLIILTGFGSLDYATEAMSYGVRYFLQKPTNPSKLKEALVGSLESLVTAKKNQQLLLKDQFESVILDAQPNQTLPWPQISLLMFDSLAFRQVDPQLSRVINQENQTIISGTAKGATYYLAPSPFKSSFFTDSQLELVEKNSILYLVEAFPSTELNSQFTQGLNALSYGFYFDHIGLLRKADLENKATNYVQAIDDYFEQIKLMLAKKDFGDVRNSTESFVDKARQGFYPVSYLKSACQQFFEGLRDDHQLVRNQLDQELSLRIIYATSAKELENALLHIFHLIRSQSGVETNQDIAANLNILIEKEYSNPELSLRWISTNVLFLNPEYLGKLFNRRTGKKFNAVLNDRRMEVAQQLLKEGLKIYQVAESVGFPDNPEYFTRKFKEYASVTPKEYQMRFLNER